MISYSRCVFAVVDVVSYDVVIGVVTCVILLLGRSLVLVRLYHVDAVDVCVVLLSC